jgi:hypothetical protein
VHLAIEISISAGIVATRPYQDSRGQFWKTNESLVDGRPDGRAFCRSWGEDKSRTMVCGDIEQTLDNRNQFSALR